MFRVAAASRSPTPERGAPRQGLRRLDIDPPCVSCCVVEYVKAFGGRQRPTLLDDGATRSTVQDDCRAAALAFVTRDPAEGGWDKLALASWLTGPYARAARHSAHGDRDAILGGDVVITNEVVEELVERTRAELLASLGKAARSGDGSLEFVEPSINRRIVRKTVREDGDETWIPIDGSRMGLGDRVRSLFAADYMNDPAAYLDLFVCETCAGVVFSEEVKRSQLCPVHRSASGVVPRDQAGADIDLDVMTEDLAASGMD